MTIYCWNLLRMINVWNKSCRRNQNAHFMFSNFLPEKCVVYEIMSKNVVEPESPQMTIWLMRVAGWISKTTRAQEHSDACARTRTRPLNTGTCYIYCFSTATVVLWRRLNVTLYVHCLSCWILVTVEKFLLMLMVWLVFTVIRQFLSCRSSSLSYHNVFIL